MIDLYPLWLGATGGGGPPVIVHETVFVDASDATIETEAPLQVAADADLQLTSEDDTALADDGNLQLASDDDLEVGCE